MKYQNDGQAWVMRLEKGEQLTVCLNELVRKENIETAWLSGLGGAVWVDLGFYDLPSQTYHWQKFDEALEITSLQGNIARDDKGEVALHLHGSFSRQDFSAIGGHVKDLEVAGTCELFVRTWQGEPLKRQYEESVGLSLLDL